MRLPRTPERRALPLLLAAALAGGAGPARAEDDPRPAGGGALRLAAEPARLLLGRDGGAELRISAPAEVEELSLSTSAGSIEGVRRLAPGAFAARYRAPAERIPQVAIVAALGRTPRGVVDGWLAIPLSGQGDAHVYAAPGTEVSLRIADRTFGPRRVGPTGVAVLPVVVPPGVREAHHGFRPIELRVPETPLLHAVADRTQVHADRLEQVRVLAYVVAPHGAARRGDLPVFEPSRGAVAVSPREPGAYEAVWTIPAGHAADDRLTIRLPGAPASRAVLRLDAIPGPPAAVAVAFDREALVAGTADEVLVTARVLDAVGNPVPATLDLEANLGVLTPAEEGSLATTARLRIAPSFGARREVIVTARAPAAGIVGSRALPLKPGPVAEARFSPAGAVLIADGEREAGLQIAVVDRYENPVRALPAVAADRGRIVAVAADGDGAWRVRYRAPAVPSRTEERVVAEVNGVRATADLLLVPPRRGVALLPEVGAALDLRGRFRALRGGLAAELGAELPLSLPPTLSFAWRLEGETFGYTRGKLWIPGTVDSIAGALLAGGSLHGELRRGPELWASATAGVLLARADPRDAAGETGAAPAARLAVGVGHVLRFGTPFAELGLLAAGRTPAGAFAALSLSAGVRFDLGAMPWRRSSSSTTSP